MIGAAGWPSARVNVLELNLALDEMCRFHDSRDKRRMLPGAS
jgi:hypothetical protein